MHIFLQVIGFLRKKEQFLTLVLDHIGTSAMMDLLLRLISCVEPAPLRQEVLNWLNEERLIQRLIDLIHCSQDEDRQSNASQTLCDLIRLSRDQCNQMQEILEIDPLLVTLESQQCVEQLLHNMFDGELTDSCVVSGTQILLTLLETRRSSTDPLLDSLPQGFERQSPAVSSSILQGIESRLKDFHHLLQHPPKKESILTTIGVLEEPLGNARLHTTRLIAALLHANTPSVNQELCRLGTMDLLLCAVTNERASGFVDSGCVSGRSRNDVTPVHACGSPRLQHGAMKIRHCMLDLQSAYASDDKGYIQGKYLLNGAHLGDNIFTYSTSVLGGLSANMLPIDVAISH
ncbi:hypothetical protein AB205_0002660 [Aquarana catesbeiana]|uniref:Uncharacterized protein n=1 Tax=Aquarana catesbeiana TaxID=8400 RepID=A0A2G9SF75_AQUCT|nr:hypothetical protein AB205_0002660 [Aquarana catesbeiana]